MQTDAQKKQKGSTYSLNKEKAYALNLSRLLSLPPPPLQPSPLERETRVPVCENLFPQLNKLNHESLKSAHPDKESAARRNESARSSSPPECHLSFRLLLDPLPLPVRSPLRTSTVVCSGFS